MYKILNKNNEIFLKPCKDPLCNSKEVTGCSFLILEIKGLQDFAFRLQIFFPKGFTFSEL